MPLDLLSVLEIQEPTKFKFHAARWNGHSAPLDVFIRDRKEWNGWNRYRGARDDFNRQFIVSFADFYLEDWTWLFGGIYEVLGRGPAGENSYEIRMDARGSELIGRLKIKLEITRGRSFRLENLVKKIAISEILKEPFTGEPFTGFENVSLDFSMLESIVRNDRLDWKTALQNVKGVYCIVDRKTGRKYVGSAYNDVGIWARWCSYVTSGHGGNVELIDAIGSSPDYAREHFRITLLETWPFRTEDKIIISRESFWKEALLTRGVYGYNRN